jgi:hypothetical protein
VQTNVNTAVNTDTNINNANATANKVDANTNSNVQANTNVQSNANNSMQNGATTISNASNNTVTETGTVQTPLTSLIESGTVEQLTPLELESVLKADIEYIRQNAPNDIELIAHNGFLAGEAEKVVRQAEAQRQAQLQRQAEQAVAESDVRGSNESITTIEQAEEVLALELSERIDENSIYRNINGQRQSRFNELTANDISNLLLDIDTLKADASVFNFNEGNRTAFIDGSGFINVRGDIKPDLDSMHPRDLMSARAALAHEYYGHKYFYDKFGERNPAPGSWNDEFRASYNAAVYAPGLSDIDRVYLMADALERAKEAGVSINLNDIMRRILYGY